MIILGIDPGSQRTGYGCLECQGSTTTSLGYGVIRSTGVSFEKRLLKIYTEVRALIEQYRPDAVALENLFHAVNAHSALKLGHARGVIMLAAAEAGLEVFEYTPLEIKSALVGYGRAEKSQVQRMVQIYLKLPEQPEPDDASDALAVGICHLHHHFTKLRMEKPRYRKTQN
ncbi:MAG: crossover junction endodeoxyribonuclease RuvC [Acidobacteria bacterium]|nr:crossover junction endodeoxyribonuclease RuvC [Acidobacteriota bacterium]